MGVTVAFNYGAWKATFPEFSGVTSEQATMYFNLATMIHANDGSGPVPDAATQSMLLNLMTSHFAALLTVEGGKAAPANTLVGRLSSVTEGSVTAAAEYCASVSASMAWYIQTKYGATYYQACAPYRTFRYRAPPSPTPQLAQLPWLYPQNNQ